MSGRLESARAWNDRHDETRLPGRERQGQGRHRGRADGGSGRWPRDKSSLKERQGRRWEAGNGGSVRSPRGKGSLKERQGAAVGGGQRRVRSLASRQKLIEGRAGAAVEGGRRVGLPEVRETRNAGQGAGRLSLLWKSFVFRLCLYLCFSPLFLVSVSRLCFSSLSLIADSRRRATPASSRSGAAPIAVAPAVQIRSSCGRCAKWVSRVARTRSCWRQRAAIQRS